LPPCSLTLLLHSPLKISCVTDVEWNDIVEQGRETQLLGQLAARLNRAQVLNRVPIHVRGHLELALLTSTRRAESASWEIATMRRLVDASIPLILLKGCAYMACCDQIAPGRIFSDIDILVEHQSLPAVETALFSAGWKPSRVNAYDAAYYRNWMHEVPPMEHVRRHTVVDLHHAINPPVSRIHIDPRKLFEGIQEISRGIFVLHPTDRVIHCGLHLLQEGEPKKLLRDLYDLNFLIAEHSGIVAGKERLRERARELGVGRLFDVASSAACAIFGAQHDEALVTGWLSACVARAARETDGRSTVEGSFARTAVLAYSHWIKMPLHLLLPHLIRKTYLRMRPGQSTPAQS
jgi:hypothetical protein